MIFQSTRPVRGATLLFLRLKLRRIHFNPRAPCGARPNETDDNVFMSKFQSTRPVRGATISEDTAAHGVEFQSTRPVRGATKADRAEFRRMIFQSTRPVRVATPAEVYCTFSYTISIHAPRAGRD